MHMERVEVDAHIMYIPLRIGNRISGVRIYIFPKSNRKAMNRNWSDQKANPALKTKTGNK